MEAKLLLLATVGMWLTGQGAAGADPGGDEVSVQCDVWAQQMGTLGGMWQYYGKVTGHGPDEAAARADAERRKWGNLPYLQNCHRL